MNQEPQVTQRYRIHGISNVFDALYKVMNRKAKIGFNDKEGHRVIGCRFDWASLNGFQEGLCLVANRENNEIKIGYINKREKWL